MNPIIAEVPKVKVLMSTFNGEKYIEEQVSSIFEQENVTVDIVIRDDGSSDKTVALLEEMKKKNSAMKVVRGDNVGACNSFLRLLWDDYNEVDYYAFADQDDVWLKEKLCEAIKLMNAKKNNEKCLYCGSVQIVDEKLAIIRKNDRKGVKPSFGNSLIENISCGCTMVFTRQLKEYICRFPMPEDMYMHDWFLYMIACAEGDVIFDSRPFVLYRQHGNNVLGNAATLRDLLHRRVCNFGKVKKYVPKQIQNYAEIYHPQNENGYLCSLFCNLSLANKFKIFFCGGIRRQNFTESVIYKLLVFFW